MDVDPDRPGPLRLLRAALLTRSSRITWVNREIEHWVATKSADHILPVVTDGEWQWDEELGDFAEDSTAVPASLRGVFTEEPLYLDLRWARDDPHLSLRHSRFRDAIAQLAAPMHGIDKDELEGEDVRQHRRAARLRWSAITALLFLSLAAVLTGALAMRNAAQANASAAETKRQQQLVAEQRLSAAQFADEARKQEGLAREQETRATEAGAEADHQEQLVRQQKALVGKASAEVTVQLANADHAAAQARQQERLAKQQSALAAESARQMRVQEQRTKKQEKIAAAQTTLAAKATADAKTAGVNAEKQKANAAQQKANADQQQRIAIGRRLLNEAGATINQDPQYALRLGVAAQRINPGAETLREVTGMVTSTRRAGAIAEANEPAYGPNSLLASFTSDGDVALWNTANRGDPVRLGTIDMPDADKKSKLALRGDGRYLATVSNDKTVSLWNLAVPSRPVRTATLPEDATRPYYDAWFSPDGQTLVTSTLDKRVYATLWDVRDPGHPAILSSLTTPSGSTAKLIAFSGDGHTLVAYHGWVDVWDVTDLRKPVRRSGIGRGSGGPGVEVPPEPDGLVIDRHNALALSAGTPPLLALDTPGGGGIQLYDLADPAKPGLKGLLTAPTGDTFGLDFSSDGRLLAAGGTNGTAIVWDVTDNAPWWFGRDSGSPNLTMEPREVTRLPVGNEVDAVQFSPDGRTLATADRAWTVSLWNIAGFAVPQRQAEIAGEPGLTAFSYAADGRSVTTVGGYGHADVWTVAGPAEPVRRATVPVGSNAVVSPDGRTVAALEDGVNVQLTDLSDPGKPVTLGTFDPGVWAFGRPRAFSPDGNTLIVDGLPESQETGISEYHQAEVQVWDLTDKSLPTRAATLPGADFQPGGAVFSPDGSTLATVQSATVSLWDLTDRAAPAKLSTLGGAGAGMVAFSSDGHTLALAGAGRAVQLWDITDRGRPRRLSALPSLAAPITAMTFGGDGQTLAVSTGPTAILWDVAQPAKPVRMAAIDLDPETIVTMMAIDKAGNTLTISATNGRLGRWDLTALNELRPDPSTLGCTVAGRGLNQDEWALVVPELPYRSTCSARR